LETFLSYVLLTDVSQSLAKFPSHPDVAFGFLKPHGPYAISPTDGQLLLVDSAGLSFPSLKDQKKVVAFEENHAFTASLAA
jgi:hypothetical protein